MQASTSTSVDAAHEQQFPSPPGRDTRRETLYLPAGVTPASLSADAVRAELAARKQREQVMASLSTEQLEQLAAATDEEIAAKIMTPAAKAVSANKQSMDSLPLQDDLPPEQRAPPDHTAAGTGQNEPPMSVPMSASPGMHIEPADLFSLIKQQADVMTNMQSMQSTLMETTARRMSMGDGGPTIVRDAETVAKPKFKDADEKITVPLLLIEIETYFKGKGTSPTVPAVMNFFEKSGNVYAWIASKIMQHHDAIEDPENIHNWTWERFKNEILQSALCTHEPKPEPFQAVTDFRIPADATLSDVKAHVVKFETLANKAWAAGLKSHLPSTFLAMLLYSRLPADFQGLMAYYPSEGRYPSASDERSNYQLLQQEIRDVGKWKQTEAHYKLKDRARKGQPVLAAAANPTPAEPKGFQGKVGGRNDMVIMASVKKEAHGNFGKAIDEFLTRLRQIDTRFQCERKVTKSGQGEIMIITPSAAGTGKSDHEI